MLKVKDCIARLDILEKGALSKNQFELFLRSA